jgi:hypothetical protein
MGITRSTGASLPAPFLPSLLASHYLRVCLFQPSPWARAKVFFERENCFGFLNQYQNWDIGGCVGGSWLSPLGLGGFQSVHKHRECCPVGVAHPDDIRLFVRIGMGPSGSVLSCWYGHGPPLRPGSVLAPLARHRAPMRPGFVLMFLSGWFLCMSRSCSVLQGRHGFSFSLLLGSVPPVEPKSSSTRFPHIPSFAGSSPSRGCEAHTLKPVCVCPKDE